MSGTDYTLTPNLGLFKPIANADINQWGSHLNLNADTIDSAIHALTGGGPYLPLAGNATVFGPTTFSAAATFSGPTTFNAPLTGTAFGTGIGQVPVFTNNGSGLPSLQTSNRLMFFRTTPAANDSVDFHFRRQTAFTGGAGTTNNILLVESILGAGDAGSNHGILSVLSANGTSGVDTSVYAQANRMVGSTASVWAAISDARDQTGLSTSATGGKVAAAHEFDFRANKADDATNGDFFGGVGVRGPLGFIFSRFDTADTTPMELSYAFWIHSNTIGGTGADPFAFVKSAFGFGVNTQVLQALDTRGAIPPTSIAGSIVAAVRMSAGHIIDFNGGPALTSAPGNYLQYRTATSRLYYVVNGVDQWSVDASGNVRARGTITPSTTP